MRKTLYPIAATLLLAACDRPAEEQNAVTPTATPAATAADAPELMPAEQTPPLPVPNPVFTSLRADDCRTIEETSEEGGYWRRACPGVRGFSLETSESDLRQALTVIAPGGARHQLELSRHFGTGGFSALGETAEWILSAEATPRTLTFRYNVVEGPDGQRETSYLGVARLEGKACVVARIPPSAGQNQEARRIAEAPELPACLDA